MTKRSESGLRNPHDPTRRHLLMAAAKVSVGASVAGTLLSTSFAAGTPSATPPPDTGRAGRSYVIRGGAVLSMDKAVGDFARADVLVEGKKILAVGPRIDAGNAPVIDAVGKIVMPGFIDTHHHQFETALRSYIPNGLLASDGRPHGAINYMEYVIGKLAPVYQPEDVYISELFGSLSQLDAGVTTVHDLSQIHHSPAHTDAAIKGIADAGRRTAFSYSESQGNRTRYSDEARRIRKQYFASNAQLMTMVIGSEIYEAAYADTWKLARDLDLPIASHVVGSSMSVAFAAIAKAGQLGPKNLLIHMTLIDDASWKVTADSGAGISLSVPIEMTMRHGTPPILKVLSMGIEPSLSSDVECTMAADFFTQMRSAMTLQRMLVNEAALRGDANLPALLTARDVIRFATLRGAEDLWLGDTVGSLTPGKEADIILLDANALNVAPLNNVPGAVVTLMDRSNVDTVIVAGKIRKWNGRLRDANMAKLRSDITASRDRLFAAARIEQNLFGN
jgi:5-methylthioadenosine/S-adenosylhomocysteine deaminase